MNTVDLMLCVGVVMCFIIYKTTSVAIMEEQQEIERKKLEKINQLKKLDELYGRSEHDEKH